MSATEPNGAPQEVELVPEAVEREVLTVCDNGLGGKGREHFASRKNLFEAVDRLMLERARHSIDAVALQLKTEIDAKVGIGELRKRCLRLGMDLKKRIDAIDAALERDVSERIDRAIEMALARDANRFRSVVNKAFHRMIETAVWESMQQITVQLPIFAKATGKAIAKKKAKASKKARKR